MATRGFRSGSIVRESESGQSYTLPPGMSPEGPCGHKVSARRKCGRPGKAMLDAVATMAPPGKPVYGHRCEDHKFRP